MSPFSKSVFVGFPILLAVATVLLVVVTWPWLLAGLLVVFFSWWVGAFVRDVTHDCGKPYCDGPDDRVYHRGR